jgi:hypothetical protein
VESDDMNDEVKNDEGDEDENEDLDFSCLPTKTLFKKAGVILTIIKERIMAKEASVRDRLT